MVDIAFYVVSIKNVKPPIDPKHLTIMSYNLLFSNKSKKMSISIIKSENPDILLVQELTPEWEKLILKEFGSIYLHKSTHPLKGAHGIGIFSKYKILNQSILNDNNKPFAQITELNFNNKKVQLINTHLASPAGAVENKDVFVSLYTKNYSSRKNQVIEIMTKSLSISNKYDCQILAGDLNTLRFEPIYKKIQINWLNSTPRKYDFSHCSFPNTNKSKPFITLDYIMARGQMKFIDTKTIKGGSSDHLAIVSKIMI
jgi:endonuclease/exonuclease/phosphatase (EEP) superfamily protein YafD